MNNFLTLVKISILESYPRKGKKKSTFLNVILTYLALSLLVGGYLAFVLNMLDTNYSVTEPLIVIVLTMFVFMQGIILLKGLYTAKDFDILEAMPIKKSHIVLSKLVSEYIIFFIYSVGISLPNVVYSVIKTHEYMIIINGILNMFLIPIFPMFVACLFATLFSYISAKSKRFSSILDIIFNIATFVLVFAISFTISTKTSSGNPDFSGFKGASYINPTYYFLNNASGKPYFYLFYILINLALVVVLTLITAKVYRSMHILVQSVKSDNKYIRKDLANKSELKTFMSLDLKRILRSRPYLLNVVIISLLGLGFCIVMALLMRFDKSESKESLIFFARQYPFVLPCFMIYINNIFVCSQALINFEGKALYIIKTLPIDPKKYIKSKIYISLIHTTILNVLEALIYIFVVKPSLYDSLIIGFIPLLVSVFENLFMLYINMRKPKFDYISEQEMVKSSQFISVFSSLLMMMVVMVLYISACNLVLWAKILIPCFIVALYIGLDILFYNLLVNGATKALKNY